MALNPVHEIVYAERDGRPLRLDLHLPSRNGEAGAVPVVVHFHGGGWAIGGRGIFPPNDDLVRAGFAVADVEYRLTSEARWPAQTQDASDAVNWIARHGREYGVDPARMGAWGLSAGAHLAAMMAVQRAVGAVVLFAAPLDLRNLDGWPEESRENVRALLDPPGGSAAPWREFASPVTHNLRGTPPTLLVHGDADELVPIAGAIDYYEKLRASSVPATFVRLSDVGHDPGRSFLGWDGLTEMAIRFFRTHLVLPGSNSG